MDIITSIVLILFLVFLFSLQNTMFSLGMIICKESERKALLSFKQDLNNSSNSLSSWSGDENCCRWAGVVCSNTTDHHVIQLHLQQLGLSGELNPSLLELKQLTHLDLSGNDFEGIRIPVFLGSLPSLRYLNLSGAGFSGMVPHQLGNLSRLQYLDLSSNYRYEWLTVVRNFHWVSHLSSLEHLDLSYVNLENASSDWFHAVNMLPSLLVLRLSDCALHSSSPSLPYVNFTSLAVLDLSLNYFMNSSLPEWLYRLSSLEQLSLYFNGFQGTISSSIGNLTKLTILDLRYNNLEGGIPIAIGNLCKLRTLDLFRNKLTGPLPDQLGRLQNLEYLSLRRNSFSGSIPFSIGRLTSLRVINLSDNKLNGSVPESLGNLSNLERLIISNNAFEGIISEVFFSTLTRLQRIELDSLVLKVSPEWIPPFQLRVAVLRNCQLGPRFSNWIQTQKSLEFLDMSSNGISDTVPSWFWNLSSQFLYLNLSHNHLNGELPKVLKCSSSNFLPTYFHLSSNQFKGPLPRLASGVEDLDLSNNLLSGTISTLLCNPLSKLNRLQFLDLSNNLLSGDLSQCWFYWTSLSGLRLGSNNITGNISSSIGALVQLESLQLQKNNLSGELPLSLRNCTRLRIIDIGENVLTGRLPIWSRESLFDLIVLRLRQNKFHGEIPRELCDLTSLQILDLADNNLSGSIPRCFSNFRAMATKRDSSEVISYSSSYGNSPETTSVVMKGKEFEYSNTLRLVASMDLSKNSLSGEIPEELASLIGLVSMNLSQNRLTGKIPEKIGNMVYLESLDFSKNRISGVIPLSISGLTFLSNLNLSYNNLSGKIPSSTQLQGFNEYCFIGNQELCGPPLKKKCNEDEPPGDMGDREVDDEIWFEMKSFYMSMGVGFAIGFWTFWGVIVLKRPWRIAYFRFLDDMKDKLYLLF